MEKINYEKGIKLVIWDFAPVVTNYLWVIVLLSKQTKCPRSDRNTRYNNYI